MRRAGLQGLMAPPAGLEIPEGHVEVQGPSSNHSLFLPPHLAQDPEFLARIMPQLVPMAAASRGETAPRQYWDGGQRGTGLRGPEAFPTSPGRDFYRVVRSDAEADEALAEGEPPILWRGSEAPDFAALKALQEAQWAAPGGTPMFTADEAGRLFRISSGLAGLVRARGGRQ